MPVSTFTLSTSSLDAGQSITVNITRADSSYTHTVIFTLGSATQQYTGVATSQAFTIPLTGASSWLYQMPNSTSGTASCVVKTYSGATLMGTAPTQNFTVKVPTSIKPTATSLTSVIVTPYWGLYVQGKSKATLTINGAAGAYGSTITGYSITSPGISGATNPYTTGYLTTAGAITFSATVTDSRGRVSDAKTCSITVTAYTAPKITSVLVERASDAIGTLADEGTYCKCTLNYTYSAIGSNTRTTKFAYKETSASTYGTDDTTLVASGGNIVLGTGTTFAIDKSYDIRFTLDDDVSSPTYSYAVLQTAEYIMDFKAGGSGVCFGGVATRDNAVEVNPSWELYYKSQTLDTRFSKPADITALSTSVNTALATKLNSSSYTAADVKAKVLTVDGSGSLIDSDLVDGLHASAFALDAEHMVQTYTEPSQFGVTVTTTTTLLAVATAMPSNSILLYDPPTDMTSDLTPSTARYGTLIIHKALNSRCPIDFRPNNNTKLFLNYMYNGATGTWREI